MYPDTNQLLRMIQKYRVTYFGTSPRYLLELEMSKGIPKNDFDLSSLRIVYTTGATLSSEQYRWFYRSFPAHIHLCNTAGGTDIATSLIAADPCGPIYAGELVYVSTEPMLVVWLTQTPWQDADTCAWARRGYCRPRDWRLYHDVW